VVAFDLLAYALEITLNVVLRPGTVNVQFEVVQWVVMGGALHLFAVVTGQVADLRRSVEERNRDLAAAMGKLEHKQDELARTERLAMLGSWVHHLPTGELQWSDETYRLFGLHAILGAPKLAALRRQLHLADAERFLAVVEQSARDGKEFVIEFRVVRADGAVRWMKMHGYSQPDTDGVVRRQYGTIMDITAEKQGQLRLLMQYGITRVLANSEALGEAIPQVLQIVGESFEWASGACWRIAPDGAALRCVDTWSHPGIDDGGFASMLRDRRVSYPVGGGFLREVWLTKAPVWRNDVTLDERYGRRAAALAAGVRGAFAMPIVSNGEVLRVIEFYSLDAREPDAALLELATSLGNQIGQFIARRTVEVALQQSQERLDLALRGSGVGLWENNLQTGVLYTSPRVAEMLETRREEIPRSWAAMIERIHADDLAGVSARLRQAVKDGSSFAVECRFLNGHGQHRWFLLRGEAFAGADGRTAKVAGSIADIEGRKRLDRAKDEFVATVSHELRTPLTAIRGALGLLHGGVAGDLPPEARELTAVALTGSERLGRLVNDILDVARVESGAVRLNLSVIAVETVLRDALAANLAYAQKFDVQLVSRCELPEAQVQVDPDRIAQVMANLISNAAKFSTPGAVVEVVAAAAGRWVRISVVDYGEGVPVNFRERMFQKFAQADGTDNRQREGTGLGLSICRTLMNEMGGIVEFTDTPGGGSTFYIELPLFAENASTPETARPSAQALQAA
jgi:signal transduction histidine kinase